MVNTSKDDNPLVPSSMQSRSTLGDSDSSKGQAHKLSDLDMIIDQNVAPYVPEQTRIISPKAMCAELAHEHALEDLHKITDHTSEPNDPTK
ncbi:hypothetical protein N7462_003948, partial [Penicillium macrosclerotiorum]|uniref:uncharacterized protein n=1 Tax=Penicillium macrosclerotiorum TaxID=303699 RepID=UPI002548D131